ncbi:MAG: D-alanyl-D-alanine carboxypeptidase family protein [Brachybacterium sp.]|nr:D-alanyl-D-alanine carboxypeptidase family protein [Brachybacterium sp.]
MRKLVAAGCAVALVAAVALIAVPAMLVIGISTVLSGTQIGGGNGVCIETGSPALSVDMSQLPEGIEGMSGKQLNSAAVIMQTADDLGLGERAQLIGIMTAMQESTLKNLPGGDRDSVGLFQQRPSQGWGSVDQLRNPQYAAKAFFQGVDTASGHIPGLVDISDWESMPLTEAAQTVQASAYPDAYAKHEATARKIMAGLAGVPISEASNDLINNTIGCDAGGLLPPVSPEGLPSQTRLKLPSAHVACPEGTADLGAHVGGIHGQRVPIRLCSIPGTVCTGSDCRKGDLDGKARGDVVLSSLVAPHFIKWLAAVRDDGYDPQFSSSFRSWESQVRISRGGTNNNAARPGYSNHQMGAAVDISGLPGSYNKHNCAGHTSDGSCRAATDAWQTYWAHGIKNGAAFHDEEFWHLEWIITRFGQRDFPSSTEKG